MSDERADSPSPPSGDAGTGPAPPSTVVGIGTSAGGLAALRAFFSRVPEQTGVAWVVVVHLSPEHESHLEDLLQPHAHLPVRQVRETLPLEADHVYVIPPGANLSAIDTHLRLTELESSRRDRAPIDHFFRTLARTHDGHAVGVILTGTGSDGSLGIKAVKEMNGLTVVQDPAEAEHHGMPQSAIATGVVDLVLPLAEIPGAVLRFAETDPRVPIPGEGEEPEEADVRRILGKILAQVRARTGRDFSRYKRSTLLRRIRRRMQLAQVEEIGTYLERLREAPKEVETLADDFLITVTNFFRDVETWERLASDVVPGLFDGRGARDVVRAWSVGCATGEEAYSLAILLTEEAQRRTDPPRIQVFASDLHERSLARAREGFYPGDVEADVSQERLRRFFHKEDGGYRVRKEIREMVIFSPHDLLSDPPFSRLDLVSCRNLLIYLQRDVQRDVMELFHYALGSEGVLVLGTSETVDGTELFRPDKAVSRVFRKRNVREADVRLPVFPRARFPGPREALDREGEEGIPARYGTLHQRMVERYAPPSMLVSADDMVVHLSEHAGRYLVHPGGELTSSAFRLVRPALRIELRTALHAARQDGAPVRSRAVPVRFNGDSGMVSVDVRPATDDADDGFCLVIFDERGPVRVVEKRKDGEPSSARVAELEAELALTKERLQAVIAEYETAQEEMRSSHEELHSSNEELRSTLEELETSKEELQSMNEELQTVNQENRHKVEELAQLSSDLQNLLAATDIATLFLDRDLHILRFTPAVRELFNVRPADRGRPLGDITHRLSQGDLTTDARRVLDRLATVDRELQDDQGRWYLARTLPYRSGEDRIEGVVMAFVDISARRRVEAELARSEERFRAFVTASTDAVYRVSPDWSEMRELDGRGFIADTEEPSGSWMQEYIDPEDRDTVTSAIGEAIRTRSMFELEHRVVRADGTLGWTLSRAVPLLDEGGEIVEWFGAAADVSERREVEERLRELNATLEDRVEERSDQLRRLASRLALAEQRERLRLSRLLHDDLQQLLYGLQVKLTLVRDRAGESEDADTLAAELDRGLDLLQQAITETRTLAVDLSPPSLPGEGLDEALHWLEGRLRELHGLKVEVRGVGDTSAGSPELRSVLFHSVRELLFNVAKHAGTDRALVEVENTEGRLTVTVSDEGLGFDPEALPGPGGPGEGPLGLATVRERLRLHGGDLEIRSAPGEGTRVILRAPETDPP